MPVDLIRYDLLAQDALRGVVKKVLADIAARGLPGDHHFFISFDTRAEGVKISERLRTKYPEEMTIVLQHQFWNLAVEAESFSVTLRFGGSPERLTIPWDALRAFADPSAGFGIRLQEGAPEGADEEKPAAPEAGERAAPPGPLPLPEAPKVVDFGAFRRRSGDGEGDR